ncbi:MAG: NAD(P)-binding domain-containing protein, partial [Candidatus Dormibacteraeota bacterium]|nr:NAD(P)-binding domain-containing protein [Candidatus Dormibacteraeota bacterium]
MRVGFVGLGAMGSRIAGRMLTGGHDLVVYNRTRARAEPLLRRGATWRSNASEVAADAEVVFTMVSDPAALAAVTEGPAGILAGLRPGTVYVDLSTVSPAASRSLAERVREKGCFMLDAPVSGSPVTIDQGQLSFMVGGDPTVLDTV